MEFELAYYDVAVQHGSYLAIRNSRSEGEYAIKQKNRDRTGRTEHPVRIELTSYGLLIFVADDYTTWVAQKEYNGIFGSIFFN